MMALQKLVALCFQEHVMLLIERIFLQDYGRNRFQYRRLNYTIAQHFVSMSHRDKQIINLNYLEYRLQYHGYCNQ